VTDETRKFAFLPEAMRFASLTTSGELSDRPLCLC